MGAGFDALAQAGVQNAERQAALKDEQRKVTLKTLLEDAETPQDKVDAIQAVYHRDPGVLKQHVENLTRRITGQKPQPVVSPEQAQQARIAPIAARGKTPEQQALDEQEASGNIRNKEQQALALQKQQQTFALIDQYIKDPEQNKAAKEDYVRKQAGITASFKNLPGAAGQPYKTPNGQWVRPVQNADGSITEQPMPASYTGPQAKPAKPLYKVLRGHAVLLDPSTGNIIRDLGAAATARTTTHQSIQYDADGIPHMVSLTSVSVPGMGPVDVDVAPEASEPAKGPAPRAGASGTPGRPKAGQLDFRKPTPQSTTAKKAVDTAENSYLDVQKASQDPTPVGDQGVILAWLRGRVNRVTTTEIQAVNNLGGARMKLEGNVVRIQSGKMTDQQRKWFLRSAKDNYDNALKVASKYDSPKGEPDKKKDDPLGVL